MRENYHQYKSSITCTHLFSHCVPRAAQSAEGRLGNVWVNVCSRNCLGYGTLKKEAVAKATVLTGNSHRSWLHSDSIIILKHGLWSFSGYLACASLDPQEQLLLLPEV